MASRVLIALLILMQFYSIFAIVENRWSQFKAPVSIQGCARIEGAFNPDNALHFGPNFVDTPVKTDPRFVYDAKHVGQDPTIWIQVCEPIGNETPQRYRETFRFEANGGVAAYGYRLMPKYTDLTPDIYSQGCNSNWIITPWGEWNGRDTNIVGYKGLKGEKGEPGIKGIKGLTGDQGPSGVNGQNGAQGDTGDTGPTGVVGPPGINGAQGVQGQQGVQGPQGATGPQGPQGITGPTGPQGNQGAKGIQGVKGSQGSQGPQGDTGPTGVKGILGAPGNQGVKGVQGQQGPQGAKGAQGAQGLTGSNGAQGVQGVQGPQGDTGPTGPTGVQGPVGDVGDTGPTGVQGSQGVQGVVGATGAVGVQGPTGDTGPQGAIGPKGVQGLPGIGGSAGNVGVKGVKGVPGTPGMDAVNCPTTNFFFLFRNTNYAKGSLNSPSYAAYLSYGRLNITFNYFDGLSTTTYQGEINTPMCSLYCDRVLLSGYGIWNANSVSDGVVPLQVRQLGMFGASDLNVAGGTANNHYYWVLPSTANPELTGPQSNPITAYQSRVWDCYPPTYVVGFVTTFIPRSTADQSNLSNRCLAYVRVDFEGRVQAYRVGACNPSFNNGGIFDFFTHLNFNGFSYTYGTKNANTLLNINEIYADISPVAVYNPNYYTANFIQSYDEYLAVNVSQL